MKLALVLLFAAYGESLYLSTSRSITVEGLAWSYLVFFLLQSTRGKTNKNVLICLSKHSLPVCGSLTVTY